MTSQGWRYLAVIIDLHSRAVIGWSMSMRMTADLVCDALKTALLRQGFPKGAIVHSDRGSQYCSSAHRKLIADHGRRQSMRRKGNCRDACVESFFGSLKVEAAQHKPIMDRETMRQAIFEYIEADYTRTRRHRALGYLSPEELQPVLHANKNGASLLQPTTFNPLAQATSTESSREQTNRT